jgi:sugar (pentulose or hexulose) kinase
MATDRVLSVDVGSSSVKAAVVRGGEIVGPIVRQAFPTHQHKGRSEVEPGDVLRAVHASIRTCDTAGVAALVLTGMGPAWLAMAADGQPLTRLVTHADRRSLSQGRRIEALVGRERHVQLAGNRPTPGGISSTTAAWFAEHEPSVMRRATTIGHWPTWLLWHLTGRLGIDPSNAGFTGLMDVGTGAWSAELCGAAGVRPVQLPPIRDAADAAPLLTGPAGAVGLPAGLPVLGGVVDGSGPLLLDGARAGRLVHSAGSSDVLALGLERAMPRDGLLCRPLGTGGQWVAAATLSSGGSLLAWLGDLMFAGEDLADVCRRAADRPPTIVQIDPRLAGDRLTVDQPAAAIVNLTPGIDRLDVMRAAIVAVAQSMRERYNRLAGLGVPIHDAIIRTGGAADLLGPLLLDVFPRRHTVRPVEEATLRGAATLWAC